MSIAKACVTIRPLWRAFGQVLKYVDPDAYETQRLVAQRLVHHTGIGTLIGTDELVWAGFVLLVNAPCGIHLDDRDALNGWVAMTCFGSFTGGKLALPQFGRKFCYKPGDLCLMRSSMVEHGIDTVRGIRYGFVATMHENLVNAD